MAFEISIEYSWHACVVKGTIGINSVWVGHPYFSAFCRFGCLSFLLCGVLGGWGRAIGDGRIGRMLWRVCVSKKLFQWSLTWQVPIEYS